VGVGGGEAPGAEAGLHAGGRGGIAVVDHLVAAGLDRPRVAGGEGVVAVRVVEEAVAVEVVVGGERVAVVVEAVVGELLRLRVHLRPAVVAVRAAEAVVAVAVGIAGSLAVGVGAVDEEVPVVVDPVAAVLHAGTVAGRGAAGHVAVGVVAVHQPVGVVVDPVVAHPLGAGGVGEAVLVGAVDEAIAVVVGAVRAHLDRLGIRTGPEQQHQSQRDTQHGDNVPAPPSTCDRLPAAGRCGSR
jgi:hypothetical protein